MSRTFENLKPEMYSSDYTSKKKYDAIFGNNLCYRATELINSKTSIKKTSMNINLYTQENLNNICVIQLKSNLSCPTNIDSKNNPFFKFYNIYPKNQNNCNDYTQYMEPITIITVNV